MQSTFSFIYNNLQPLVNSAGLLFDIAGAVLVAWEVVVQFDGQRLGPSHAIPVQALGGPVNYVPPAQETAEYTGWENAKYRKMKIGLVCLVVGFMLQITSNWVPHLTATATVAPLPSVAAPTTVATETTKNPVIPRLKANNEQRKP